MFQKIQLIGYVGNVAGLRYTAEGVPVLSFGLATTRTWKDKEGNRQQETVWFRVSLFGEVAESLSQYINKGRILFVEGRLLADPQTGGARLYTRKDGTLGASFEVVAQTVKLLGRAGDGAEATEEQADDEAAEEQADSTVSAPEPTDLPF